MTHSKATPNRYAQSASHQEYHARRYGDLEGRLNLAAMRRTLSRALAGVPRESRVLDMPCGTGQYCWHLAAAGYQTTAADVAPEMLKIASSIGPAALPAGTQAPVFLVEDVFHLSFPPNSFAASICIRLFNLLNRSGRIAALRELARVSRTVIVSYNHPYTMKHLSRVVRHRLGRRSQPKERFNRECVRSEAAEAGLELQKLLWVAPVLSEVWLAVLTKHTQ